MPESENNPERALVACGLWLHTGYVGLVGVGAGLILLFVDETNWLTALGLALCGGVLAVVSLRRARAILGRADEPPARAPAAPRAARRPRATASEPKRIDDHRCATLD